MNIYTNRQNYTWTIETVTCEYARAVKSNDHFGLSLIVPGVSSTRVRSAALDLAVVSNSRTAIRSNIIRPLDPLFVDDDWINYQYGDDITNSISNFKK